MRLKHSIVLLIIVINDFSKQAIDVIYTMVVIQFYCYNKIHKNPNNQK